MCNRNKNEKFSVNINHWSSNDAYLEQYLTDIENITISFFSLQNEYMY